MAKTNKLDLLKYQFDALVNQKARALRSIDELFDDQFRRRFSELINQTAQRNSANIYNWPRR